MEHINDIATNQFFQREHFDTFTGNKVYQNEPEHLEERKGVQQQLLYLDDLLYPEIQLKRWGLHRHNSPEHIVSGIDIDNPFIAKQLRSIWLHYGKDPDDIKQYQNLSSDRSTETFIHHSRMQVIIYNHAENGTPDYGIGAWLIIGKNNGSNWDRDFFKNSMRDEACQNQFLELIHALDEDYFISCNGEDRQLREFADDNAIADFTHENNFNDYFIIGRAFEPQDPNMSNDTIVNSMMTEFGKLYPICELTRHKF